MMDNNTNINWRTVYRAIDCQELPIYQRSQRASSNLPRIFRVLNELRGPGWFLRDRLTVSNKAISQDFNDLDNLVMFKKFRKVFKLKGKGNYPKQLKESKQYMALIISHN